jgi:hypothetical protein
VQAQRLLDMFVAARLEVREADLVELAVDRPEVGRLHLARARLAGLDRRLVHRDDAPGADRRQLGVVDRLEQLRCLLHELRQPGPAQVEARVDHQPLNARLHQRVHVSEQRRVSAGMLGGQRIKSRTLECELKRDVPALAELFEGVDQGCGLLFEPDEVCQPTPNNGPF